MMNALLASPARSATGASLLLVKCAERKPRRFGCFAKPAETALMAVAGPRERLLTLTSAAHAVRSIWSAVSDLPGVRFVVRMAARTVGLGKLAKRADVTSDTSIDIFLPCHRLQVRRVHTATNSTQVIDLKPFRNWADKRLVDDSVSGADGLRFPSVGVAALVDRSRPSPTAIAVDSHLCPEPAAQPCIAKRHRSQRSATYLPWHENTLEPT